MKKFAIHAAVSAAALMMLAACGGGGGDAPAAAPVTTPVPVTSSALAYAGNWARSCVSYSEIQIVTSATGVTPITTKAAYRIALLKNIAATASGVVAGQSELQYFDNPTCAGTAKDKQTANFSFTIDGQAVVSGKTVDRVTATEAAIGGLSAGTTITINGVVYPGNYFTRTNVAKNIFLVEGTKWSVGTNASADQYPTELNTIVFFTKQ